MLSYGLGQEGRWLSKKDGRFVPFYGSTGLKEELRGVWGVGTLVNTVHTFWRRIQM